MSTAIVPSPSVGLAWTPEALEEEVEREKALRVVVIGYYKSQLRAGHHYYNLPGEGMNRKPALAKEGALNLCSLFKVTPEPDEPHEVLEDNGHYTVRFRYRLRSVRTGQVVATGDGSCSTREAKYAYRLVWPSELDAAMKVRAETGEIPSKKVRTKTGWTTKYRFPNLDLADTYNTVLKMASKRALVDAGLKLPLVSELFTQDLEEQIGEREPDEGEPETAATERAASTPADPTAPQPSAANGTALQRLHETLTRAGMTEAKAMMTARKLFPEARRIPDLTDEQLDRLTAEIEVSPAGAKGAAS